MELRRLMTTRWAWASEGFTMMAVIYRNRNQIEKEIRVSKKAIAFYEHVVFVEHLESMLPMLNQFTKKLKAAKSILASQRNK